MAAAKVSIKEVDLSTRVPTFPGVFGGMVIQAKKGPVDTPFLVTSDTELLSTFTPDDKVEVGFDLAYFEALTYLEKSDKLWVVRSAKDSLYAGASVKRIDATTLNQSLPVGQNLSDPSAYIFDSNPDVVAVAQIERFTAVADVAGNSDLQGVLLQDDVGSVAFWIDVDDSGSTIPGWASAADRAIEVTTIVTGELIASMATKLAAAIDADSKFGAVDSTNDIVITHTPVGARTTGTDGDTFFVGGFTVDTAGVDEVDLVDEIMLIHSKNQGDWGNDVLFKITTFTTDPDTVKVSGAFIIDIFKSSNLVTPVESHLCSRVQGAVDGFGANIYVEDVLTASNFITVVDNLAVTDTILPLDQAVPLALATGSDGTAVTDAEMIISAQTLSNTNELLVVVLMDGGFATATYGQELEKIANLTTGRGDCVALLSVPNAAEIATSFMTDIVVYRKTTLNLNSSYAALYSPHVKIFDRFNNRQIFISPTGFAGAAISASAANFEIWFPPAGFTRGNFTALDLRRRFTDSQMDVLTNDQINPLRFAPGKGLAIWGQLTLLSVPSALSNLNVRLMLISVEPAIKEALENFLFELNDSATRSVVTALLNSALSDIQARRGVVEFRVVADSTNNSAADIDAGKLNVDIFLRPTLSVNEIPTTVVITSTGVSFDVAAQAL